MNVLLTPKPYIIDIQYRLFLSLSYHNPPSPCMHACMPPFLCIQNNKRKPTPLPVPFPHIPTKHNKPSPPLTHSPYAIWRAKKKTKKKGEEEKEKKSFQPFLLFLHPSSLLTKQTLCAKHHSFTTFTPTSSSSPTLSKPTVFSQTVKSSRTIGSYRRIFS